MTITDLVNSDDRFIASVAQATTAYKQSLSQGLISQSEYDELVGDLLNLKHIDDLGADEDRKREVFEALQFLMAFAGLAKSL